MTQIEDIRLIAIDLDGTLLTDSRDPHPRAVEAIQTAREAGITVVLASGRAPKTLLPIQRSIGLSGPIVACNGAYVLDESGGAIYDQRVSADVRDQVAAYARQEDVQIFFYLQDQVIVVEELPMLREYVRRVKIDSFQSQTWAEMAEILPTKVLLMDEPDAIQRHLRHLEAKLSPEQTEITISEPVYLEFLPSGVTKATGLAALAATLNLEPHQVAAIGDYQNDLAMLLWAGYSGAVENAHPEVLGAVNRVFPTNNNGGVADFILSIVYNH